MVEALEPEALNSLINIVRFLRKITILGFLWREVVRRLEKSRKILNSLAIGVGRHASLVVEFDVDQLVKPVAEVIIQCVPFIEAAARDLHREVALLGPFMFLH